MNRLIKLILLSVFVTGTIFMTSIAGAHAATGAQMKALSESPKQVVAKTVKLASHGKTINSERFGIGSKGTCIQKVWGQPDQGSDEAYLYYNDRKISFQLENNRVTWITSFDQRLENITVTDVEETAGKPEQVVYGEDGIYFQYKEGKYRLEFVFYYDENNKPGTFKEIYVHKK
ncbi:DUF4309 domain-containing protein [Thermoactinomyces sp. CICC 10522]|jgi:hypothetical protein|uniref:DUF4309 domain-containing protein n=1 Tax=Thermoactinomyces sp. CICC 10522 TaxID=2767427 RepID=UPI0018DB4DF0|nr:DUF4309 domain-containing protein [Thermoactinomyces sp. CICC 10522]MBH8605168.1 DUF4309 domain-containing protein [Thermoactinomyces sp. CICC 10522]